MTLYEPERHLTLVAQPWSAARARSAIRTIAADTEAQFRGDALWPVHPIDLSPERSAEALIPLFNGAAGVIWALRYLHTENVIEAPRDYGAWALGLLERQHRDDRTLAREASRSFALADTGILMLQHSCAPSLALEDRIHSAIDASYAHPSLGFAWGAAGGLLAALHMRERTAHPRWSDLFRAGSDLLWARLAFDASAQCHLWTMDLYGHRDQQIGALHGFAGIAYALQRGAQLLPEAQRIELAARVRNTLTRCAIREDGFVNWPLSRSPSTRESATERLLQFCIGAPGILSCAIAFADAKDTEFAQLLLAAGELVWSAGPTSKLPSLCHGAPGSGYALLRLYEHTGDERWLARARAFAMHAIDANEGAVQLHSQRKFSLFTGDLGLAIYLMDCIRAAPRVPLFDVF